MSLITHGHFLDRDHFLEDLFAPLGARRRDLGDVVLAPAVDVKDKDDHYEITAELPGVDKDDIHIHLEKGILTLEAESRQEASKEEAGKVIRQERRYGKIMRSFNLGEDAKEDDISADFKDGILKLQVPKHGEKTPLRRRIEIG